MGLRFTFQIGDGAKLTVGEKLKTPGVDFGPGGLVVVHRSEKRKGVGAQYVVVRRPGHTGWSGVGSRSYYEASYRILRVTMHHCSAKASVTGKAWDSLMAEEIVEESGGRKWREVVKRLVAKCDGLQTQEGRTA